MNVSGWICAALAACSRAVIMTMIGAVLPQVEQFREGSTRCRY
jgi:hypothetical protein